MREKQKYLFLKKALYEKLFFIPLHKQLILHK